MAKWNQQDKSESWQDGNYSTMTPEFHSDDITHSDTIERISLKSQIMYKQNHCGCTICCCCFNMLLLSGTYQEESIQTLNQPTHPSVHHLPPCLPTILDDPSSRQVEFRWRGSPKHGFLQLPQQRIIALAAALKPRLLIGAQHLLAPQKPLSQQQARVAHVELLLRACSDLFCEVVAVAPRKRRVRCR